MTNKHSLEWEAGKGQNGLKSEQKMWKEKQYGLLQKVWEETRGVSMTDHQTGRNTYILCIICFI